jgi:DNA-binding transcriptional regulator YiaG
MERTTVKKNDILELMRLKGWTQAELGRQLEAHESTVSLWISGQRNPRGPACKLMRQWLAEARKTLVAAK